MDITDIDINEAEKILLPKDMHFDDERRDFIKSLESCDLLAVPGSGKTTALQAKLFCMSRHLPLDKGQGILVLSHTNNAVNEVKKKLYAECNPLFEEPHFIGTVQDFVDKFLAIPFYEQFYKQKVHVIDGMAYEQEVERYLKTSIWKLSKGTLYLYKKGVNFTDIRIQRTKDGSLKYTRGMDDELSFKPVKKWIREGSEQQMHEGIKADLLKMKKEIMKKGILHYDDCYILADAYMRKYTFVKTTLRKRFKYIFIDETQDLKKYQLDLIDSIFDCAECCIQRIGDKNQTIFNKPDRDIPDQWNIRKVKYLQNSLRLTESIAKVVNPFAVDNAAGDNSESMFTVIGKRQLEHGDIPPYLILFDENAKNNLLTTFNDLIELYKLRSTKDGAKYGFHIVGWSIRRKNGMSNNKLRLEDIFPNCAKASEKGQSSYDTLSEFLVFGCREHSMYECKTVIQKALVCLLRKLNVSDSDGRLFSKTRLENKIMLMGEDDFDEYKLLIYQTSVLLFQKRFLECYTLLVSYLTGSFSRIFEISTNHQVLANFCEEVFDTELFKAETPSDFPDIEIGSVHSTKGQTHCATMYVDTSFRDYESSHLFKIKEKATRKRPEVLYPNPLFQEKAEYTQVTCKAVMHMMYVGFSRPTHLLCYASYKRNWNDERIEKMEQLGWKIINL